MLCELSLYHHFQVPLCSMLELADLLPIPVSECGSDLVPIPQSDEIVTRYDKRDMLEIYGETMWVRAEVLMRLQAAASELRQVAPEFKLKVVYAYRTPEIQLAYFERELAVVRQEMPHLGDTEARAHAHLLVADPRVAGHPTGGAVDVTIVSGATELDMGCRIADRAMKAVFPTFVEGISAAQAQNRFFLRDAMLRQGFAPFDGEWWHFSYGDREWAAYWQQAAALYDVIASPEAISKN